MALTDVKYAHYRFCEECADEPAAILALVERMFGEIAALPYGRKAYFRMRPEILHRSRWTGDDAVRYAVVRTRFSLEREEPPGDVELLGFGLENANMGRSHKDRDEPPIKATTLRPLMSHDVSDNEAGMHPIVGHGDPLSNDEATEHTGEGVVIGNEAPGPRKIGEGPGENEGGDEVPGGEPDAKS